MLECITNHGYYLQHHPNGVNRNDIRTVPTVYSRYEDINFLAVYLNTDCKFEVNIDRSIGNTFMCPFLKNGNITI